MGAYNTLNNILVELFNDINRLEEKAIITGEYKDITNNDMHIIDAIGNKELKNMTSVAKSLNVTVGTMTIAINNLVKKGYVKRQRSDTDRRVVLISLTEKGNKAYKHHEQFHREMIEVTIRNLNNDEKKILIKALKNLNSYFRGLM